MQAKTALAEKKAAAEKKALAEKKAQVDRKSLKNKKVNSRIQIDSQQKRESRTELLTVSVSLNTGKIVSIASIGILASAILVSAMFFIAG